MLGLSYEKEKKASEKRLLDGIIRLTRKLPSHLSTEFYKEIELLRQNINVLKQELAEKQVSNSTGGQSNEPQKEKRRRETIRVTNRHP